MKRRNDKKYMIVSLFIVVLSLAVGYAIFADTLNIAGTAQTTGSFDIEFFEATVTTQTLSSGASATISGDKNTLTLVAPDLQEPGATVVYTVTVKNVGTVTAELIDAVVVGAGDDEIDVITPTFTVGTTLVAEATYQFDIEVFWDPAVNNVGDKDVSYSVTLDYQQAL